MLNKIQFMNAAFALCAVTAGCGGFDKSGKPVAADGRSDDGEAIVHDRIDQAPRHFARNRLLKQAFDFIRTHDLASVPIGRYAIAGDDCYALVQELDLKPLAEGRLELHRDYIDIQLPIDGSETFGLANPPPRVLSEARWDGRDIVFFDAPMKTVTVKPGEFIMMFPLRGAHAPCLTDGPSRRIRKLVIKVRAENFTNDTK